MKFFKERDLIRRIQKDDRTVLGQIYLKNEAMIANYLIQNGGQKADAEDLLQEAIVVLWQKVKSGQFELKAKVSTFLFAVVKNKWRAIQRKNHLELSDFSEMQLEASEPDALFDLENRENIAIVERCLKKLSAACQKILRMYYFEYMDMNQISQEMNFAGASVAKTKKYQCKKRLISLYHIATYEPEVK